MSQPESGLFALLMASVLASTNACWPKETEAIPASLLVTATADEVTQGGFFTSDGWEVHFERFLTSIGLTSFPATSDCVIYSTPSYTRILNMLQPGGSQKVNAAYALGQCDATIWVGPWSTASVLGPGVSSADAQLMTSVGSDQSRRSNGTVIYLAGRASKGEVTKSFVWRIQQTLKCSTNQITAASNGAKWLAMNEGESATLDILVQGEALFRDPLNPSSAELRFDHMAAADTLCGNNDGVVGIEELGRSPLDIAKSANIAAEGGSTPVCAGAIGMGGGAALGGVGARNGSGVGSTLASQLYDTLYPKVFRCSQDGACVCGLP